MVNSLGSGGVGIYLFPYQWNNEIDHCYLEGAEYVIDANFDGVRGIAPEQPRFPKSWTTRSTTYLPAVRMPFAKPVICNKTRPRWSMEILISMQGMHPGW